MANITTVRKIGNLARAAAKQAGRTRTFGALMKAARAATSHWSHVLGQLWLEVTGFVFLSLAALGAVSLVRELANFRAGTTGSGRIVAAILFTLMFTWFGLSSFWRVRKKR